LNSLFTGSCTSVSLSKIDQRSGFPHSEKGPLPRGKGVSGGKS